METQSVAAPYVIDRIESKVQKEICCWNAIFQGHTTNPSDHTNVSSN